MKNILLFITIFVTSFCFGQERTVGLFENTPESYNGYTLFSSGKQSYLIDNCGFKVNEWNSQFRPGLSVYLLSNGNLLRTGATSGPFNAGGAGGMFEIFDWEGNLLWSYKMANNLMHSHHDVAPLPNGNFLAITWSSMLGAEAVVNGRLYDSEVWMENILEIEPVGENEANIVWEWHLQDHLVQDQFPDKPNYGIISESPGKMDFNYLPTAGAINRDWTHLNAISYNEELDQIAVSSRNFSEIWVIDHSTTVDEAKTSKGGNSNKGGDFIYRYGNPQVYDNGNENDKLFSGQHNVEWIVNDSDHKGDMTVFSNLHSPVQSAVHRWTPPYDGFNYKLENERYGPEELSWSYVENNIFSPRISGAQILPNNNILICVGEKGDLIEITEKGDEVWYYVNPVHGSLGPVAQGASQSNNSTFRALRYSSDFEGFDGKILEPTSEIELDPLPSECIIYDDPLSNESKSVFNIKPISNLVQTSISFEAPKEGKILITNLGGVQIKNQLVKKGLNTIDLHELQSGIYFISYVHNTQLSTFKFVKL